MTNAKQMVKIDSTNSIETPPYINWMVGRSRTADANSKHPDGNKTGIDSPKIPPIVVAWRIVVIIAAIVKSNLEIGTKYRKLG